MQCNRCFLCAHINEDSGLVEGLDGGLLAGRVAVELVAVPVPVDGVDALAPVELEEAGEHGARASLDGRRYTDPGQQNTSRVCRGAGERGGQVRSGQGVRRATVH